MYEHSLGQLQLVPAQPIYKGGLPWIAAVKEVEGVRLGGSSVDSGEGISIDLAHDCAEVYLPDEDIWVPAIFWHGDRASMNVAFDITDDADPVWVTVKNLARRLKATIAGDEGEAFEI